MVTERREAGRKGKGGRSERICAWSEGEGRQVGVHTNTHTRLNHGQINGLTDPLYIS